MNFAFVGRFTDRFYGEQKKNRNGSRTMRKGSTWLPNTGQIKCSRISPVIVEMRKTKENERRSQLMERS